MRLAVVVQSHPSRAAYARRLARKLGRDARIVTDPEPDGERNPWRCARACWAAVATHPSATHGLVIQEDAIPCGRFLAHARRALAAQPERVTSFYLGDYPTNTARNMLIASVRCAAWVRGEPSSWCPAIALAIPIGLVPSLVEFDDGTTPVADDEVYGRWCRNNGLAWWATIPSLVNHDDDAPSLMRDPLNRGRRVASCWIGSVDPGLIDWSID